MSKLKPCPFCGSKNVEIIKPYPGIPIGRAIKCNDCRIRVGISWVCDDDMAIEAWNKRSKGSKKRRVATETCLFCGQEIPGKEG